MKTTSPPILANETWWRIQATRIAMIFARDELRIIRGPNLHIRRCWHIVLPLQFIELAGLIDIHLPKQLLPKTYYVSVNF